MAGTSDFRSLRDFMANITLPLDPPEEFFSLIPAQRAHINQMIRKGVITSYCLSLDRSRLWVTLRAHSEEEVVEVVVKFPLIRWMEIEIQPLMFRETAVTSMPPVSLN
jgi:muconolactone delta-isomerase